MSKAVLYWVVICAVVFVVVLYGVYLEFTRPFGT